MRFLGIIWEDLRRLNSKLPPAAKITILIVVMLFIFFVWYEGAEYWGEHVMSYKFKSRPQRGSIVAGFFIAAFASYLFWVIDRYRSSR